MNGNTLRGSREIPYLTLMRVTKVCSENPEGERQGYTEVGSRTAS